MEGWENMSELWSSESPLLTYWQTGNFQSNQAFGRVAMHSISILASKGSAATWYVEREGKGAGKSVTETTNFLTDFIHMIMYYEFNKILEVWTCLTFAYTYIDQYSL